VITFSIHFPSEVSKNVKPPPTNTLQGRFKKKRERGRERKTETATAAGKKKEAAARVHHCLPLAWAQNLANCLGPDYRFSPIRRVSIN